MAEYRCLKCNDVLFKIETSGSYYPSNCNYILCHNCFNLHPPQTIHDLMGKHKLTHCDLKDKLTTFYRIYFKNGGGWMGVDNYRNNISGKTITVYIGKCTCYKNGCDCVTEIVLPRRIIKYIEEVEDE